MLGGVKIIAGDSRVAGKNDGAAAHFNLPKDVCLAENGYLYVADYWNNVVRKITTNSLLVEHIEKILLIVTPIPMDLVKIILEYFGDTQTYTQTIGSGKQKFVDGRGKASAFCRPSSITCYKNFVFVADQGDHKIRVIDTNTDNVTTLQHCDGDSHGGLKDWKINVGKIFVNSCGHLIVYLGKSTGNLEVRCKEHKNGKMMIVGVREIRPCTFSTVVRSKSRNYFISGHSVCFCQLG